MTTENYPEVSPLVDTVEVLDRIVELRSDDIKEFNNLPQRFVGGRKGTRIPSSSTDVIGADLEGDINYDATHLYILLNTGGGNLAWRRVAITTF